MINLVIAGDSIDKQTALNEIQPHVSVELGVEKVIKMQVGSHYLLAKSVAGKNELLKDLVGLQKGDDLIIFHADGSKIVFADYYLFCTPNDNAKQKLEDVCSVTVSGKDGGQHTFTAQESTDEESKTTDVSSIVYTQGNQASLDAMLIVGNDLDSLTNSTAEPGSGLDSASISDSGVQVTYDPAINITLSVPYAMIPVAGLGIALAASSTPAASFTSSVPSVNSPTMDLAIDPVPSVNSPAMDLAIDPVPKIDSLISGSSTANGEFTVTFSEVVDVSKIAFANIAVDNGHSLGTGTASVSIPGGPETVVVSNVDLNVDGTYSKLDPVGLVVTADFTPADASDSVIDLGKPVYSYTNGSNETWYIWSRISSGYNISQLNDNTKWFVESGSNSFEPKLSDVKSWEKFTNKTGVISTDVAGVEIKAYADTYDIILGNNHTIETNDKLTINEVTDLGGNKVDLNFHTPNLLLPSVDLDGGSRNYSWTAEASLANVVKGISLDNGSSQATVNILGGATSKLKSVTVTLEGIKDGTKEVLVLGEETVITGKINHGGMVWDVSTDENGSFIFKKGYETDEDLTVANVQALIRALTYKNTAVEPTNGDRTVKILVTNIDGLNSNLAVATVKVDTDKPTLKITRYNQLSKDNEATPESTDKDELGFALALSEPLFGSSDSAIIQSLQNSLLVKYTQLGSSEVDITENTTMTFSKASDTLYYVTIKDAGTSENIKSGNGELKLELNAVDNIEATDGVNKLTLYQTDIQENNYTLAGNLVINSILKPWSFGTDFSSKANFEAYFDSDNQTKYTDENNYSIINVATYDEDNQRLKLNSDVGSQFGGVYLTQTFTASSDIRIKFSVDWGDGGPDQSDGMSVFLFDGAITDQNFKFGKVDGSFGMDDASGSYAGVKFTSSSVTTVSNNTSNKTLLSNVDGLVDDTFNGTKRDIEIIIVDNKMSVYLSDMHNGPLYLVTIVDAPEDVPDTFKIALSSSSGTSSSGYNLDDLLIDVTPYTIYVADVGDDRNGKIIDDSIKVDSSSVLNGQVFVKATVDIGENYVKGEDILSVSDLGAGVEDNFDVDTGMLTIRMDENGQFASTGISSDYINNILQRVKYANSSNSPISGVKDIEWTVTSKDGSSSSVKTHVRVRSDSVSPVYIDMLSSNQEITLVFNEDLNESLVLNSSAFTVFVGSSSTSVTNVEVSGKNVILTVNSSVSNSDLIDVTYSSTLGNLEDVAGNDVAAFNKMRIGGALPIKGINTIQGTDNVDTIIGTVNADIILGLQGSDKLTGGAGSDVFDYNLVTDGDDTITDFEIGSGGDILDLSGILEYSNTDTLSDFLTLIDQGEGKNVTISIDANGNNSGTDMTLTLSGIGTSDQNLSLNDLLYEGNLFVL